MVLRWRIVSAMAGFLFLQAAALDAQQPMGSLTGSVVDFTGEGLPGVKVTSGSRVTFTDSDGRFHFPALPEGDHPLTFELEGFMTVDHDRVGIRRGETTSLEVTLSPDSLFDYRESAPLIDPPAFGSRAGSRPFICHAAGGGFQMGFIGGSMNLRHVPLQSQDRNGGVLVNSQRVADNSGSASREELGQINSIEDKRHRINSVPGLAVNVPLGRNPCAATEWGLLRALVVGLRRADVSFESRNTQTPAFSQTFTGGGLVFDVGFQGAFGFGGGDRWLAGAGSAADARRHAPAGGGSRWLVGFGYVLQQSTSIDMTRSVDVARTFFPPGSTTLEDGRHSYKYRSHTGRVTVGSPVGRMLPYGGLAVSSWNATLNLSSRIDITNALSTPPPPGTQVVREDAVRNTFGRAYAQGLAGLTVQVAGPIGLNVEGRFGDRNTQFVFGGLVFLGGM